MKKTVVIFGVIFALLTVNIFAGGNRQSGTPQTQASSQTYELAFITDIGSIDDGSFNQGSWEGVVRFGTEYGISYKHYQSEHQSNDARLSAIDNAVKGGAKLIIASGYLFEVPIHRAQDIYPFIRFILIDSIPNNGNMAGGRPSYKTGDNTVSVLYAEDQAGFLAGYAAVADGYRQLGFIGGVANSSVIRFGYGFIQGAEYAAQELGLTPGSIAINYHYSGQFTATPQIQSLAASWYNTGVEVIFACGGAVGSSVMAAAEQTGGKVIGVDIDQSGESAAVITSAMKMLQSSVYDSIAAFYSGRFPGGQTLVFHAANNGVGLPMDTSRFRTFNKTGYDSIYRRLSNGAIPRIEAIDAYGNPSIVPVSMVRITEM
ncbi:MAG: BMP family ABC transporter substrate-binding protein [Treponema sp.]|nr:BMP family ABC transporter substrate-binding protein [Treponema sp.]